MDEKMSLWDRVEDWFDRYNWEHSYATVDIDGSLIHIQCSGRDWCQGAHYIQSGPYTRSGKTKLIWSFDGECGHFKHPNGKEVKHPSSYLAVILFSTIDAYDEKKRRYTLKWDGKSSPRLFFRREIFAPQRCGESNYKKSPFISSKYIGDDKAETIGVPDDFLQTSRLGFRSLIDYIQSQRTLKVGGQVGKKEKGMVRETQR